MADLEWTKGMGRPRRKPVARLAGFAITLCASFLGVCLATGHLRASTQTYQFTLDAGKTKELAFKIPAKVGELGIEPVGNPPSR